MTSRTQLDNTAERPKSNRRTVIRLAVIGLIAVGVIVIQNRIERSSLFTLEKFKVTGLRILEEVDIIQLAGLKSGVLMGDIDLNVTADLIRRNPLVADCRISRVYPSTLRIEVSERRPIAFVNLDELYAVDSLGVLLPHLKPRQIYNLPVISGAGNINLNFGRIIESTDIKTAVSIINGLRSLNEALYYDISEVHLSKGPPMLFLTNRAIPVILGEGPYEYKLTCLNSFLKHCKKTGKMAGIDKIDLRFDRRVIVKRKS